MVKWGGKENTIIPKCICPSSGLIKLAFIGKEGSTGMYALYTNGPLTSITKLKDISVDAYAQWDQPPTNGTAPYKMTEFYGASKLCCFTAGTQVWMVDGSYKNIENIQVDEVIKGNTSDNTVLELVPTTLGNRLLYGFNGGDAFFTPEHPFMTTEGWKAVSPEATISESIEGFDSLSDIGRLEINDVILGSSNVTINSIVSSSANSSLELYNFNVDGDNTYYADNYVVHNKCFVGDTLITMWDKTYKPIEEIQVGDKVFTQLGNEEVLEIFSPVHDNILEYTFSDGTKTKNTSDHPYYVVDKGWCSNVPELTNKRYDIVTNEFVCGDICVNDNDKQIELVDIEELGGEFQTYTFSVNSKTYYANKILVHSEI
jgi:hypothetical protein